MAFSSAKGFVDRPLQLPCGQCIGCRAERSRQWALRCTHEAATHKKNCFITLTYDNKNLPDDKGLDVEHWKLFIKRLRKKRGLLRYFHCGEYGEANLRPHYHACIFGLDFNDKVFLSSTNGNTLYQSEELTETWGKGLCSVGALTYQSAAYVARYVMKKITGPQAKQHYERVDPRTGECWEVRPDYVTMSRRPGIGKPWLEKFKSDVYPNDQVIHEGRKFRPPRYYDLQLSSDELLGLKYKRRAAVAKRAHDLTPERLQVREKIAAASMKQLTRNL